MKHPEYQYLNLLKEILEKGFRKVDRGTGDASYSLFGKQIRFDLSEGFPILTTKKVYWKGVLEELYWFMSGNSNVSYLTKKGVHIWDDYPYKIYKKKAEAGKVPELTKEEFIEKLGSDDAFGKEHGELPKIYGELWRRWPTRTERTIDQLAWVMQELKDDPNAHNLIVNSWNPEYLYTMATNEDASRFPICHNIYQLDMIDGKLNLQLYQRSADIFLGVPFNIASYALLTLVLAQISGYQPGEFVHTFGDVHIYENHLDQVKEQLTREPMPFPNVKIDPSVKSIDDFKPESVELINYQSHPALKAELSVSGGFFEGQKKMDKKIIPTAAVVAFESKNVLLVKHGKGATHLNDTYGLPGGTLQPGETNKECALREFQEETGLVTSMEDLVEFPNNFYKAEIEKKDGSRNIYPWRVFLCTKFTGSIKNSSETVPEWHKISDLSNLNLLPNVETVIKNALNS